MQPSEKSLSAPGNPKASTHTNRCLSCLFSARKSFAFPRPPGGFFMFLSRIIRPQPDFSKLCLFCRDDSAAPSKGLFSYGKFRERRIFLCHTLLQNQTRVCGIVRCTACSAFLTECGNLCPRKRFFADRIWGGIFQSREKGKA